MSQTVLELQQLLQRKTEELHEIFEKHKSDTLDERGQPTFDMDAIKLQEVRERKAELGTINKQMTKAQLTEDFATNAKQLQDLSQIDRGGSRPATGVTRDSDGYTRPDTYAGKSLGEIVAASNEYKFKNTGNRHFSLELPDADFKTLISTAAGFSPANNRGPKVVDYANRRLMVADLVPTDPTINTLIRWMEQTTFTNAAAGVSQGGLKPESADVWTEKSATVEKIATWVPVTEEQIDDVPGFQGLINRNLILKLQLTEETYLLTGSGVSPQMLGFLNHPNIQTQAKGGDDTQDAFYRSFTKVRYTGFAEPSGIVIHPNDWEPVRLLRTTDGLYINGSPQAAGEETLWGKPVVVTPAITEGTGLTGDFNMYSHISRKLGIRIDVSNSHDTYFIYNKLAIRAEMRESLEIYRGAAFAKVTGI